MAKRKSPKKSLALWQWALVALLAFILYQGLQSYLTPQKQHPKKSSAPFDRRSPSGEGGPSASTPESTSGPIEEWNFKSAARLLPAGAYPDNYLAIPLQEKYAGLLAYAKILPGKPPGPQGLTNTQPALMLARFKEGKYQQQELAFSELQPALAKLPVQKLTGLPQVNRKPLVKGKTSLFSVQLFLEDDPREITAFVVIDENGLRWAPLHSAHDEKLPAAFLKGTTQDTMRKVETEKHASKEYVIVTTGKLNTLKPYEGYRWQVEAYAWDGQAFVYDKEYSEKLTKEKMK